MFAPIHRRTLLAALAAGTALAGLPAWTPAAAANGLTLGDATPFSFSGLIEEAQSRATRPYAEPARPAPELVEKIGYSEHGALRFKPEMALNADRDGTYPATFFHLGTFFPKTVKMHALADGRAREIVYSPSYFDMPAESVARRMPSDAGFAGFRLHESTSREDWQTQDWVAFLGASYFRAIGALNQYGLSARGVAVDSGGPMTEEFPDFVAFYIQPAEHDGGSNRIYALLDGPSISGAFAFDIRRTSGVVMDVDARLFTRKAIERLGIAPLTSMFWYGEYNRPYKMDWRPEVHDSDGLLLWTGADERIWRSLNNPRSAAFSSFIDDGPKGFGLMQRDRNVENYLDGVNYDRRPSLWVEPLGDWGKGAVQLVELPTDDEIHDNIVAFWRPAEEIGAGAALEFRYRLHWLADEPYPADLARVVAVRIGRGGRPGQPRPDGVAKFVVEFAGGPLAGLTDASVPDAQVTASSGEVTLEFVERVTRTERWRVSLDVTPDGDAPVEIRLVLRQGERRLSETWKFQLDPARLV